jgi:hypothetical protein
MVRVDHAWNDHMVLGLYHAIGCVWQVSRWSDGLNAVVSDKDRSVVQFIA